MDSTKSKKKSENKNIKKSQFFLDLPFIGKETDILGKKLIKVAESFRPDLNIQPIPRPPPALIRLFQQKDSTNKEAQSNIVYMISCADCNESYIGKTIRQASRRHLEHGAPPPLKESTTPLTDTITTNSLKLRRSERLQNKQQKKYCTKEEHHQKYRIKNKEQLMKSAIYKHNINTNHNIDWNNWKVISRDTNKHRLLVRESLQILLRKPSLNRTVCSIPLIVYPEGLQTFKPTVKLKSVLFDGPHAGTNS